MSTGRQSYFRVVSFQVPSTTIWRPKSVYQFMLQLVNGVREATFLISAVPGEVGWSVEVPHVNVDLVVKSIKNFYPQANVEVKSKDYSHVGYAFYHLETKRSYVLPLQGVTNLEERDPLAGLVGMMTNLTEDEAVVYELSVRKGQQDYFRLGKELLTQPEPKQIHLGFKDEFLISFLEGMDKRLFGDTLSYQQEKKMEERQEIKRIREKEQGWKDYQAAGRSKLDTTSILLEATLGLKVKSQSNIRVQGLSQSLQAAMAIFDNPKWNYLNLANEKTFPLVLSPQEIAALWHPPTVDCYVPEVIWSDEPQLAQELAAQEGGVLLGHFVTERGQEQPVRLLYEDRVGHINVIGKTRVGKSTLLHNLIFQDIAEGKTVAVIDPHGKLVDDILATSIPKERERDVVLFDVADKEYPIGLNFLKVPEGVEPYVVAEQAQAVIRKLFADQWGDRMETVSYNALGALVYYPKANIYDVTKFLTQGEFRAEVLDQVDDFIIVDYWKNVFDKMTASQKQTVTAPIIHRINGFYRNPILRHIICQPHTLNFRQIIDSNKIFLASLRGIGKAEAELLGAMLISKFQVAGMSREFSEAMNTVYLYIDELQNFVTTSLPVLLSEAAKFGLSLVTANQYLRQLTGPTLDAVLGTVGTNIVFATGPDDARLLGSFFAPFTGPDLERQDKYKAIIKMQASGQTIEPFSMMTLPPKQKPKDVQARVDRMRTYSRTMYSRPVEDIDREITGQASDSQKVSPQEVYRFYELGKMLSQGQTLSKEEQAEFQRLGYKINQSIKSSDDDHPYPQLPPGTDTTDFDPDDFSEFWE